LLLKRRYSKRSEYALLRLNPRAGTGYRRLNSPDAVGIALISGAAWDLSAVPAFAFVPLGICAIALAAMALEMRVQKELR